MMLKTNLSVILPTYNEAENIVPLISAVHHLIRPQEIIVVDDGSPDGTAGLARSCKKRLPEVRVIVNRLAQACFGGSVRAYTSGMVMARKSRLQRLSLRGDYGEYCIDFLVRARRMGYAVSEVPFTLVSRTQGVSKTASGFFPYVRKGMGYIRCIVSLLIEK